MKCGSQLAPHDVLDIQIMSPPDLIFFGTKQYLIDNNSTDFDERENFVENREAPKTHNASMIVSLGCQEQNSR